MSLQLFPPPEKDTPSEKDTAPEGFEYHRDFLTEPEGKVLLTHINHPDAKWLKDLSRRVMHFGYKYDYASRMLDESALIGPLPEWLQQLAQKVRETASEEARQRLDPRQPFDQAIINEYNPGQGIAAHIDRDCFGPIVATVSLGSAINMDFRQKSADKSADKSTDKKHIQRVEERSLIVLQDAARNEWTHEIKKRKSDTWQGQKTKRFRRTSITFRTIRR